MQRRTLLLASLLPDHRRPAAAQTGPKIAVTDLAYTENVRQYFEVGTAAAPAPCTPGQRIWLGPLSKSSGTYVAGTYSYMEQRELAPSPTTSRAPSSRAAPSVWCRPRPLMPARPSPPRPSRC